MTDIQKERVQLSYKWKLFQIYAVQIACGSLSAFWLLSLEVVEKAFIRAELQGFYAMFFVVIIVIGIIAIFFSGGIGLLRLINAKRVMQMIEKEGGSEDDN